MNADVSKWRKGCCQSGVKVVFGRWKSLLHFFVSSDDLKCTSCYSWIGWWVLQGVLGKGLSNYVTQLNTNNRIHVLTRWNSVITHHSEGTSGLEWSFTQLICTISCTQLSNHWWIPNSVRIGSDPAMKTGSSRRFKRYPTTCRWVSSQIPFTEDWDKPG